MRGLSPNSSAYGSALGNALLRDPHVATAFAEARAAARGHTGVLQVRLLLDAGAPELNEIRWECLRDLNGNPLFTGEQILFSRFLSGPDWGPGRPPLYGELKALLAIANPSNLEEYAPGGQPLARIHSGAMRKRIEATLTGIRVTNLDLVTLANLVEKLREGFDILYLVCHGAMIDGEARLWLENDRGLADVVSGTNAVDRFRELAQKPRLVILASCQSAGAPRNSGEFEAIGPRLAEVGVPAVLAMQGNLSMETEAIFMPTLFRELLRDGQIDRAVAAARGTVRSRPDYWVPLLYIRLRSGRLWSARGEAPPPPIERWDPGSKPDSGRQREAGRWPSRLAGISLPKDKWLFVSLAGLGIIAALLWWRFGGPASTGGTVRTPEPGQVRISKNEVEPNNDFAHANIIKAGSTLAGEIANGNDTDYFRIRTGPPPRDIYRFFLKNMSQTLAPGAAIFDGQKNRIANEYRGVGTDLDFNFAPAADADYYAQVYSNGGAGPYSMTITPLHRYDAFEPNDDILSAKAISLGKTIEANIMDDKDTDFFQVKSGAAGGNLTASLANKSTRLAPGLAIY